MYWSYSVKGKFPEYEVPKPKHSNIKHKLEKKFDIQHEDDKRNHVIRNIKEAKQMSPP